MKRLMPVVLAMIVGCGGAATTSTSLVEPTTTLAAMTDSGPTTTEAEAPATTVGGPATTLAEEASTGAIPAECAAGFTEYLKEIEPIVAGFDPATAKVGDYYAVKDAVGEKSREALEANDYEATYSCSEVGLEFAYFDSRTPWAAVLVIATDQAPGTAAYLEATQEVSAMDVGQMTDYGAATCDEAVARHQANCR